MFGLFGSSNRITCPECNGRGSVLDEEPSYYGERKECPTCGGLCKIDKPIEREYKKTKCSLCNGNKVIHLIDAHGEFCPQCGGRGYVDHPDDNKMDISDFKGPYD